MANVTTQPAAGWEIELVGERRRTVTSTDADEMAWTTKHVCVECASGERYDATWSGVAVGDVLELASAAPETTHLVFESDSGYAACVPLRDALGGLVAVERDGERLGDSEPYATRFVAPDVDGARFVKGVSRIRAVVLTPDEDATEYEALELDGPEYGRA
ncbi:molybdopterin-dependent oxidoreductase [Halogeometricum borinquense]|uniref:molybdopterin-dependent oxidoreductase n=1 Tax=Halogeometricum borinquense TaxID=60847 RepID=UPI001EF86441|nr:molybdopterin-dependent oxidoreductase [Halogeometricum borinquense]